MGHGRSLSCIRFSRSSLLQPSDTLTEPLAYPQSQPRLPDASPDEPPQLREQKCISHVQSQILIMEAGHSYGPKPVSSHLQLSSSQTTRDRKSPCLTIPRELRRKKESIRRSTRADCDLTRHAEVLEEGDLKHTRRTTASFLCGLTSCSCAGKSTMRMLLRPTRSHKLGTLSLIHITHYAGSWWQWGATSRAIKSEESMGDSCT